MAFNQTLTQQPPRLPPPPQSLDLTIVDRTHMLLEKYENCRANGTKLSGTVLGPWSYWTYRDYNREANFMSRFFVDFGGEQAKVVCILSYNRREWFASDVAAIWAGMIPAGIYPTDTSKQIEYILNHSEAQFIVVENQKQLEKIRQIRNKLIHLKEIVVMDDKDAVPLEERGIVRKTAEEKDKDEKAAEDEGEGDIDGGAAIEEESQWALEFESHVHYWSDIRQIYFTDAHRSGLNGFLHQNTPLKRTLILDKTAHKSMEELDALDLEAEKRRSVVSPEDVACMIYTSGTTGPPKAVMITHRNIGWCIFSIGDIMHISPEDTIISYLPLCHIAEKTCALYGPLTFGLNVHFAAPDALRGTLIVTLRQVGPTVFFGVPRIWEKIQERMVANSGKQPVYFLWCIPTGQWGKDKWKNLIVWARGLGLKGAYAQQQQLKMPKNWW